MAHDMKENDCARPRMLTITKYPKELQHFKAIRKERKLNYDSLLLSDTTPAILLGRIATSVYLVQKARVFYCGLSVLLLKGMI
jgi:hypothetical protein